MSDFQSYEKIENIKKLWMSITQKIHGTNGQIYIDGNENSPPFIMAGSRSRWLTADNDNAGFFKWVMDNKDELIAKLGRGRHYGEWCGKGINAGEGLDHKKFVLFNWQRHHEMPLPENVCTVPVLYSGKFSLDIVEQVMADLKATGSRLCEGYMKPEGVVVSLGGTLYKKVFEEEDVAWKKPEITRANQELPDVSHLLQPLRLEKLLSKDERYVREYPDTLQEIFSTYVRDLIDEGQITACEEELKLAKRALGRILYPFIREMMDK